MTLLKKIAQEVQPKILVSGTTAYPRLVDFTVMQEIAESVGAVHLADMSHIAGLVAGGAVKGPLPFSDVVTTTTHKTLRGPRGAMIFCRPDLAEKIDRAVFPGLQGGPHENTIGGIAVALKEALQPEFAQYAKRVLENAQVLAEELIEQHGFDLVTGGTDTHLILIDLTNKKITGQQAETALGKIGITVNKNTVPGEKRTALDPSGIRVGTPALTSRGVRPQDMKMIASWIAQGISKWQDEPAQKKLLTQVQEFAKSLPLPGVD